MSRKLSADAGFGAAMLRFGPRYLTASRSKTTIGGRLVKSARLLGGIAATTVLMAPAAFVHAQTPQGTVLEEVTVNARRTEENLQKVPVAITALTAETLEKQDIRTFQDLAMRTPGLDVCCARGSFGLVWMRAVPGVVGYFSEVPADLGGSGLFFDVNNMQVLKGPQGTLFGIATNGGAILAQPARPTEQFEGWGSVTVGDYGRATGEGVVNIPLADNKVLLRIGAQRVYTDGYIHDLTNDEYLGGDDYWVGRIGVTVRATDRLENYLLVNYSNDKSLPAPNISLFHDPLPTYFANAALGTANVAADVAEQNRLGLYQGYSTLTNPRAYRKQLNVVNITEFELTDHAKLRNLAGYEEVETFSRTMTTLGRLPYSVGATPDDGASGPIATWSEELQLQGTALDGLLTYTLGSFNSGTKPNDVKPVYTINYGRPAAGSAVVDERKTHALYGQGTYDLSALVEGLSFTAGYRYTWDSRDFEQTQYDSAGVAVSHVAVSGDFSAPSYTLGVQYQLNPDVMLFVTNSKGSSSGGFNATAPASERKYNPEFLNNIEAGVKAEFTVGGVQARTNVSAYYGFYDDVQVRILKEVTTASGPIFAVVINNAAEAIIKGVEADISVIPADWLELNAAVQYGDSDYEKYNNLAVINGVPTVVDYRNAPFVGFSKWKYNFGAVVHLPVPATIGRISLSADYAWKDELFAGIADNTPDPRSWRPAMGYLDMGARWTEVFGNERVESSLTVTNVLDEEKGAGHGQLIEVGGLEAHQVHLPRMFSLRMQYRF